MSNEEMALAIQAGDTALYAALWEQTKRLMFKKVNAFVRRNGELLIRYGLTVEDLYQVAFLALVFAVDQYQPEKGILLISYFNLALKREIQAAFCGGERKQKIDALNRSAELDAPINDNTETTWGELLPDPYDMEEATADKMEREALWAAVDRLPEMRREIIKDHYRDDIPLTKVAVNHGWKYPKAQMEHNKALKQLRQDRTLCGVFADRINFYSGTGLSRFRHAGASSVELAYEWMEQHGASKTDWYRYQIEKLAKEREEQMARFRALLNAEREGTSGGTVGATAGGSSETGEHSKGR